MPTTFRKIENLHIVLWLLKDYCWISNFKIMGMIMIVPTLLVSLYFTWKMRSDKSELAHNLAVTSWICANSTWMLGEFFLDDSTRLLAKIFFFIGFGVLLFYYMHNLLKRNESDITSTT
jgi:hypothetical protein